MSWFHSVLLQFRDKVELLRVASSGSCEAAPVVLALMLCVLCGCGTSRSPGQPSGHVAPSAPGQAVAVSGGMSGGETVVTDPRCPAQGGTPTPSQLLAVPPECFTRVEDIIAYWTLDKSKQYAPYESAYLAEVAGMALIKLIRARGDAGRAIFVGNLESASREVRKSCIWGLSSFEDVADIPLIMTRLIDVSADVRASAVGALASYGMQAPLDALRNLFANERDWSTMYAALEALAALGDTEFMIDQLQARLATPRRSEAIRTAVFLKKSPRVTAILVAELKRNLAKHIGHDRVSTHVGTLVDGQFEGRWIVTPSDNEDLVSALVELKAAAAIPLFHKLLALDDERRGMRAEDVAAAIHSVSGKPVRYRESGAFRVYPPVSSQP